MREFLATLRRRDFALLWSGGLISMTGDWMLLVALPIYVYGATGSALVTGAMFAAGLLPNVLFGSVAGVFVDRWDRKRTMVVANLLLAVSILPLLVVPWTDWLWVVYAVAFVQSCFGVFSEPAENSLLPRLVERERLVTANSLNALNNNAARLVGPALAGLVVGWFGLVGVVVLDATSFLIAALLISLISASGDPEREAKESAGTADRAPVGAASFAAVWREWLEGLGLVTRGRVILTVFMVGGDGPGRGGLRRPVPAVREGRPGRRRAGTRMADVRPGGGGTRGGRGGGFPGRAAFPGAPARPGGPVTRPHRPRHLPLSVFRGRHSPGAGAVRGGGRACHRCVDGPANPPADVSTEDQHRGRVFGALGTTQALLMLSGALLGGALGDAVGIVPVLVVQGFAYVAAGLLVLVLLRSVGKPGGEPKPGPR